MHWSDMCQLYVPGTNIKSVKEKSWFLFSKWQYTDEKLPSTKAALEQMMKRNNYVATIWKQSGIAQCPTVLNPTSHRWFQEDQWLQPLTTTKLPAP